ncbi:ribonuclease III [Lentithecium fluviatile CBS 122367]|uniref:Ribonuclease III n=1 Tax=Lentithecium fluviatile CBS 122367 TaxID=1168545 RepID=A0A6G1IQN1_9PLEO|nr:ribonuclease III [Lentithecium fluviatile CBS 122367]
MYNSNQKRGGLFNHYDNDRSKKPRPNHSENPMNAQRRGEHHQNGHGHGHPPRPQQDSYKFKNKDNPVLNHIDRLPDPTKCEPCKLAAAEMQTGMIALLDKLEAEELMPDGDRDVLHHARELRRLLSARASKTQSFQAKKALDEKRPPTDRYVSVPAYIQQKMERVKELPKLPHITEPYLQEAVFTHISHHNLELTRGVHDGDKLSYDRLEFLGDAYIELVSSRLIHSRLPNLDVPQQSHLREQLVKNETLGQFSHAYGLPDRLKHGGHMGDSKAWTKVVADVFEAYVAAVVLSDPENGFQTAEKWLTELWAPQFMEFKEQVVENPQAKDELSRMVACKGVVLHYRHERDMVHVNGVQKYFIGVYMTGWGYENEWLGSGEGRNKGQGGVYAAMDAIRRNNPALKTAIKKKQELLQQKKEEETRKEVEEKGDDAIPKIAKAKFTEDAGSVSKPEEVQPKGNSWLEKEKKKKGKKERQEKKRKETS